MTTLISDAARSHHDLNDPEVAEASATVAPDSSPCKDPGQYLSWRGLCVFTDCVHAWVHSPTLFLLTNAVPLMLILGRVEAAQQAIAQADLTVAGWFHAVVALFNVKKCHTTRRMEACSADGVPAAAPSDPFLEYMAAAILFAMLSNSKHCTLTGRWAMPATVLLCMTALTWIGIAIQNGWVEAEECLDESLHLISASDIMYAPSAPIASFCHVMPDDGGAMPTLTRFAATLWLQELPQLVFRNTNMTLRRGSSPATSNFVAESSPFYRARDCETVAAMMFGMVLSNVRFGCPAPAGNLSLDELWHAGRFWFPYAHQDRTPPLFYTPLTDAEQTASCARMQDIFGGERASFVSYEFFYCVCEQLSSCAYLEEHQDHRSIYMAVSEAAWPVVLLAGILLMILWRVYRQCQGKPPELGLSSRTASIIRHLLTSRVYLTLLVGEIFSTSLMVAGWVANPRWAETLDRGVPESPMPAQGDTFVWTLAFAFFFWTWWATFLLATIWNAHSHLKRWRRIYESDVTAPLARRGPDGGDGAEDSGVDGEGAGADGGIELKAIRPTLASPASSAVGQRARVEPTAAAEVGGKRESRLRRLDDDDDDGTPSALTDADAQLLAHGRAAYILDASQFPGYALYSLAFGSGLMALFVTFWVLLFHFFITYTDLRLTIWQWMGGLIALTVVSQTRWLCFLVIRRCLLDGEVVDGHVHIKRPFLFSCFECFCLPLSLAFGFTVALSRLGMGMLVTILLFMRFDSPAYPLKIFDDYTYKSYAATVVLERYAEINRRREGASGLDAAPALPRVEPFTWASMRRSVAWGAFGFSIMVIPPLAVLEILSLIESELNQEVAIVVTVVLVIVAAVVIALLYRGAR